MEKIAMKCTRAEYESIREFVGELSYKNQCDFRIYKYLLNLDGNKFMMDVSWNKRKVYEKFDKDVFLKACGIKVSDVKINLLYVEEALGKDTIVAINTRVKKDKRTTMFKKALKIIKSLNNEHCNITYIGTDSGYDLNAQGDTELDGSFTITITGNKTK